MAIVEQHTSPDGMLTLIVDLTDGDWSIGFDKFAWHTHGDVLTHTYGGSPESATRAFVDEILASRCVIVIEKHDGNVVAAWVTDDPDKDETAYLSEGETIEKRVWRE